jgi:ABC-type lipoprotein release transport system permease subunit
MRKGFTRHGNIVEFLLSSLLKKKGKTLALLLVFSFIVFLLASVMFFSNAIRRESSFLLIETPEMIVQRRIAGRHELVPFLYAERIARIEGVASVKTRLWGYYYDPITGANYTLLVPGASDPGMGTIVIGEGVSRTRLVFQGDTMEFKDSRGNVLEFRVKEVFPPQTERISSDLVLISDRDFRSLFNIPAGYWTDLAIHFRDPVSGPEVADQIRNLFPDVTLVSKEGILATYENILNWHRGLKLTVLAGMFLALLILALDKASGLSEEEKKEIGILKAIGWQSSDVLLLKLWEGMGISISSFLLGILLGYVHVFLVSSAVFQPVLKGWAVLYPDFKLTPSIDPFQLSMLFLLAVLPYTLATVLPVLKAATVAPDDVMRT